jgi:hypothetical protein
MIAVVPSACVSRKDERCLSHLREKMLLRMEETGDDLGRKLCVGAVIGRPCDGQSALTHAFHASPNGNPDIQ